MRRSTWICLDDCQAPFVAHLQSPWGASGKPRSWRRRFPDKRYRGPTGATRSTVYPLVPSLPRSTVATSFHRGTPPRRSSVPRAPLPPALLYHTALHLRCGDRDRDRDSESGTWGQGRSDDGDDARRNERWEEGKTSTADKAAILNHSR